MDLGCRRCPPPSACPPGCCVYTCRHASIHEYIHMPTHTTMQLLQSGCSVAASEEHTLVRTARATFRPKGRQAASRLRMWRVVEVAHVRISKSITLCMCKRNQKIPITYISTAATATQQGNARRTTAAFRNTILSVIQFDGTFQT